MSQECAAALRNSFGCQVPIFGECLNEFWLIGKRHHGNLVFGFQMPQSVVCAGAHFFDDWCDTATDVEQEQHRQRQLVLTEVDERTSDVLLVNLEVLLPQSAKDLARFLVDNLGVKDHQVRVHSDNVIWVDLLRGCGSIECQTQANTD